jgi:hypothetical protein
VRTSIDIRRKIATLSDKERTALAKKLSIEEDRLAAISGRAQLMAWKGLTPELALQLQSCDAGSYATLETADAALLQGCLWRHITGQQGVPPGPAAGQDSPDPRVPSVAQLDEWIQQARRAGFTVVKSTVEREIALNELPGLSTAVLEGARKQKWTTNLQAVKGLATGAMRAKFAKKRKLDDGDVAVFYGVADLTRMPEMAADLALLLVRAGITNLSHLSGANLAQLEVDVRRANERDAIVGQLPDRETLGALVERARDFPKQK